MQSHQKFYPPKAVPTYADQLGENYMCIPVASAFDTVFPPCAKPLPPIHGIEFQPSEVCPKNFIIFNQTDHRNQIMFNPAVANNLNGPGLNGLANYIDGRYVIKDVNDVEKETSSSLKEDSDDIDALLSSEEGEQEDYDEVSTARTYGNYESDADSRSAYDSKPRKDNSFSSTLKSSGGGGGGGGGFSDPEKRLKMKKMVKMLRGIFPGGNDMGTVAVLDEAVLYLKSLKVEAQKLGFEKFMNGD
ncbi:Glucan endo-1,3-beta-glucosidase-beta-glucanase, putative isoform 1 [Hibiscus syriacus]|uniref:Glucan endo-1,3-beta-glucosidase-beta-glucanase, putative isoform 1 n=1 Tax=Hibiscus syriacus TaxID=106335 RepID=A0A6A3BIQ4_HIBSY|nr:transcription factor bHLH144-like [Hibiscus syriacus]KAE8715338.1 Glucan endo-1,3-beta-glucosidase-beta-glucanase, putative isoform 1 [Hibiscus syriacus]